MPPAGFGETVAVSTTGVPAVVWPPTLPLVKTFVVSPLLLVLSDVVVAVADSVVKVIVHDPSDPVGLNPDTWVAIYSVQVPCNVLPAAGRPKALLKL